jgi:4-amino-4-deoxy-L-arabinose transferase-like glycosyltransferase
MKHIGELFQRLRSSAKIWQILAIIFLLAFALRLFASGVFEGLDAGPSLNGFGVDGVEFNQIAANIVQRHEYSINAGEPTTFRAPGFPLVLAFIYEIFGVDNYVAARIFFALIGALLIIPTFFLAREATNKLTAIFAALIVASYPNLIYYNIHFASEPLYTLLLATSALCLFRAIKQSSWQLFFVSGLVLGFAALTRPVAVLFFPFFAIAGLLLSSRHLKRSVWQVGFFCLAGVLTIAPWSARNYLAQEKFSLITTNGGSTFWGSNNELVLNDPHYRGDWVSTETFGEQKNLLRGLPEVERDQREWEYGKAFLKQNPQAIPRLLWYKLTAFWTPILKTPNAKFNLIVGLSYAAMLPFIFAGFWLFLKNQKTRKTELAILSLSVFITLLNSLIFYGSSRFRCTIEPMLLIFAASAITALLSTILKLPELSPFNDN